MPYSATAINTIATDHVYIQAFRDMISQRYQEGDRITGITKDRLVSRDYYMSKKL